ncbi:MAG: hypothetical protein M1814_003315 [Vezdaea aestivalis]|nr:MAG: hypothetical protein M1814_003315 [Vezdaea aestivalis]
MTRAKVPPEARQRTANACDSCKRRKSKCDGMTPCQTCTSRKFTCIYTPDPPHTLEPPAKKQKTADSDHTKRSPKAGKSPAGQPAISSKPLPPKDRPGVTRESPSHSNPAISGWGYSEEANAFGNFLNPDPLSSAPTRPASTRTAGGPSQSAHVQFATPAVKMENMSKQEDGEDGKEGAMSHGTTASMGDEEAVLFEAAPMVPDSTGRMVYIGESATLSFLQLLRLLVENLAGESAFTRDPRRHHIIESSFGLPLGLKHTHVLPDRVTADVLVESYFTNTQGLVHAFDKASFQSTLEACYMDPLQVDPSWLCLLNLVFAIGLSMANPAPGTSEEAIIEKLRSDPLDRAEIFYANAKSLHDPVTGFEDDAGFWSVQALLLMTIYMLLVSKRNAGFAYFGMAVRYAFALGLHREETFVIFSPADQLMRRNVWRSLFVMDRLLSATLGRPTAIHESDCSGNTLQCSSKPLFPQAADPSQSHVLGLEAAVRSSHAIGDILRRIYQRRRISTRLAQEIADACKKWPEALAPILHWGQAAGATQSQGVAILHVNLLYCHSIILLTRPFFLNVFSNATQRSAAGESRQPFGARMEKFAEACVIAGTHSIGIVRTAWVAGVVSRRNPFVNYFLFTSTLVALANSFCNLYPNPTADPAISQAIAIMGSLASMDPQAQRHFEILSAFRDVVVQRRLGSRRPTSMPATMPLFPNVELAPAFSTFTNADMGLPFTTTANPADASAPFEDPLAPFFLPGPPFDTVNTTPTTASLPNFPVTKSGLPNGSQSVPMTTSSESSSSNMHGDEAVDFESLWAWAAQAQTPGGGLGGDDDAVGVAMDNNGDGDEAGPLDPSVPLYGLVDFG